MIRRLTLVLCALAAAVPLALGAGLELLTTEEVFVFGGRSHVISVSIQNTSDAAITAQLSSSLYQASSSTIAPAGERATLPSADFPPKQTTVSVTIAPPEVRAISSFMLKLDQAEEEIGTLPVRVCPTNLLANLKSLADEIALFETDETLAPLFEQNRLSILKATPDNISTYKGKLAIARLAAKEHEESWNRVAAVVPRDVAILFIVSPGVTGAEKLAALKTARREGRPILIVQEWFVPELATSPLSQLRLLRAIELLLEPDKIKTPRSAPRED